MRVRAHVFHRHCELAERRSQRRQRQRQQVNGASGAKSLLANRATANAGATICSGKNIDSFPVFVCERYLAAALSDKLKVQINKQWHSRCVLTELELRESVA